MLQAARNEPCRMMLMAGRNAANDAFEALYLTTRLKNPCKIHIAENSEWLKSGVHLVDLRFVDLRCFSRSPDSARVGFPALGIHWQADQSCPRLDTAPVLLYVPL